MKFNRLTPLIALLFIFGVAACAAHRKSVEAAGPAVDPAQQETINKAMASLNEGNYNLARSGAASFIEKYPTSQFVAEAQYILALSYLREGQEEDARRELAKLVKNFPNSAHTQEAADTLHTLETKRMEEIAMINAQQRRIAEEHDRKVSQSVIRRVT